MNLLKSSVPWFYVKILSENEKDPVTDSIECIGAVAGAGALKPEPEQHHHHPRSCLPWMQQGLSVDLIVYKIN